MSRLLAALMLGGLCAATATAGPVAIDGAVGVDASLDLPAASVTAIRAGDRALRGGEFSAAAAQYARSAEAAPRAVLPRLLVGVALSAARRPDLAAAQFQAATQRAGDDLLAVLLLQGCIAERGDSAGAQALYLDAVRRFSRPGRPGLDASRSVTRLKAAVAVFPESPIAWLLLGDAYQVSETFEPADRAYRRAMVLAPTWAKPRVNLGLLLLAQNKPEQAVVVFEAALRSDPDNVAARLAMGEAQLKSGRNADAIVTYRRIERAPQVAAFANTGLAQASVNLRRYDDAIRYLDTAQNVAPRDPAPVTARAQVQITRGDYSGAADSLKAALRLSQEGGLFSARPSLLRALAEAQLSAHRPKDALETLRQAVQVEPDSAPAWHRLSAHAYEEMGDRAEMEQALRRALDAETDLFPQDTLNAIAARGLVEKFLAAYRTDLEAARTGVGTRRSSDGDLRIVSGTITPAGQVRCLAALGQLYRYQESASDEVAVRRDLCAQRGLGRDWFLLAEAQERLGERADARASYGQALTRGGLPVPIQTRARQRIAALENILR
jgi:tetratricopeptide (TPR) repeat protein